MAEPTPLPGSDQVALADVHRRAQVQRSGQVELLLAELWDRTLDPADVAASFERFRAAALPILQLGRAGSEALAQQYYEGALQLAGYSSTPVKLAGATFDERIARGQLGYAKVTYADYLARSGGAGVEAELERAKVRMLGAAKRYQLNAGRARLLAISGADPNVLGWARVSDGSPCYFCAMLVSRGPVYSAATVHFRAHTRCGCGARIVFRNDRDRGWTDQARDYQRLWQESGAGSAADFRSWLGGTGVDDMSAMLRAVDAWPKNMPALSLEVLDHIIIGRKQGRLGGHRSGAGIFGKTEFPPHWGIPQIVYAMLETLRTPGGGKTYPSGQFYRRAVVDDVVVEIRMSPDGEVISSYPRNGRDVIRNGKTGPEQVPFDPSIIRWE